MSALLRTTPSMARETSGTARSEFCTTSDRCMTPFNDKHVRVDNSVVAQTSITGAIGDRSTITNSNCFRNSLKTCFNSSLVSMVGGSGGPGCGIAGRNAKCVDRILPNNVLERSLPPETSSTIPRVASGATERVSDGFLRSQSTTMTDAPFRAMSCPTANATVDFPFIRNCGSEANHPARRRSSVHLDRQFDRTDPFGEAREGIVDGRSS